MGWNLFHDGLEVAGFHGVDRALRLVNVGIARFHGGDVREDFVIAEVAIHRVEDLHRVGWWGLVVVDGSRVLLLLAGTYIDKSPDHRTSTRASKSTDDVIHLGRLLS